MSRTRYILSVDLGSGGPKVAIVSEQGDVIANVKRTNSLYFVGEEGVEQEPEEWWVSIKDGARELLSRNLVPVDDIIAIAVAGQWGVTVPVDRSGKPLMRAVHWTDHRGGAYSAKLMDGLIKIAGCDVFKLWRWVSISSGAPLPSGADALSNLLLIKNEFPKIYEEAYCFLEPFDYLNYRLTGRMACSYASIFPYMIADTRDCSNVKYSEVLLKAAGIDRSKLPELVPVDTVLGPILPEVAAEWGLSPKTQVMVGAGDSHTSILGSGAVNIGQPHMCIGTSSWITCLLPRRRFDLLHGLTSMPSVVPGYNMLVAEQGPAGKVLELFVEQWFSDTSTHSSSSSDERYLQLLAAAESTPPGSNGVRFLPWLNGSGPPNEDGAMRGGFLNLSLKSRPPDAVRAVMEGVGFNLRWLATYVEKITEKPLTEMNFIGGGARSPIWCQILADVLGKKIHQVADPHYAIVRGVALSALVGLKLIRVEDIPSRVRIERTFLPDPGNQKIYDELFGEFLRMFKATRPLFHRWQRG